MSDAGSTFELFLARPRSAGFNGGHVQLVDLDLRVRLAQGLDQMVALVRRLEDGSAPGRKTEWGAWLGPFDVHDIRPLLHELGLQLPPDVEHLDEGTPYLLVAVET